MHYDGERSLRFAKHGMLSRKFWWVPHYDVGVLASCSCGCFVATLVWLASCRLVDAPCSTILSWTLVLCRTTGPCDVTADCRWCHRLPQCGHDVLLSVGQHGLGFAQSILAPSAFSTSFVGDRHGPYTWSKLWSCFFADGPCWVHWQPLPRKIHPYGRRGYAFCRLLWEASERQGQSRDYERS